MAQTRLSAAHIHARQSDRSQAEGSMIFAMATPASANERSDGEDDAAPETSAEELSSAFLAIKMAGNICCI